MKKILGLYILLIVLIFGCRQTYWMVSSGGNLNLYPYNSSDVEMVTMEVFVNGESVNLQDHSNRNTLDHQGFALYRSTGGYEVEVVASEYNISKTAKFNLLTVKWINIEFTNDDEDPDKYVLNLSVESSPQFH